MPDGAKALGRDEILAADDLRREDVDVPEWGGSVLVRELSAAEAAAFAEAGKSGMCDWVAAAACSADGARLFAPDDAEALGRKCLPALHRVFAAVLRVNAVSKEGAEGAAKNSEAARSGDSSSA